MAAFGGVAVVVVLAAIGGGGSALFTQTQAFLDFGAGVLALVSLSVTVLWGLAATDRMFLQPNHRLIAQGVHRATAVAGIAFLMLHIWVKVSLGRTSGVAVAVPFLDVSKPLLIGLGTIASYLFIAVAISGAMRSVFTVNPQRARRWRILHIGAYPAWGAALIHGLKAGRPAAAHITAAYVLCVIAVAVALVLRRNLKKSGAGGAKGPRAPLGELPSPGRRSNAPALPGKPKQDPVGLLDRPSAGRDDARVPALDRPSAGRDDARVSAQDRTWAVSAQAAREPDLPWLSRDIPPLDAARVRPAVRDDELPWPARTADSGAAGTAGPRPRLPEPLPVSRPEPARGAAQQSVERPAYDDGYARSWDNDPLTGLLPVMTPQSPSDPVSTGLGVPGPMPSGPVAGAVQDVPAGMETGTEWPTGPEPVSQPTGAAWPIGTASAVTPAPTPTPMPMPTPSPTPTATPMPSPAPAATPAPTPMPTPSPAPAATPAATPMPMPSPQIAASAPWGRVAEPSESQSAYSPWSTGRPPVGEPWAPTPDPSQTGRRVNGRVQ